MKEKNLFKIVLILTLFGLTLSAQGHAAEIYLQNGDRLSGVLMESAVQTVRLNTEILGIVEISRKHIERIVDEEAMQAREAEKEQRIWDGKAAVGFQRTRGNTNTTELNGSFLIHRKVENENEFHLKAESYYSAEDRKMNSQRQAAMIRYAYSFGESRKWYHFFKSEFDRDRFSNIDFRGVPSTGLGYWFYDKDEIKLMAELAAGYSYTSFRDEKEALHELVLVPRAYGEIQLYRDSTLSQEAIAYPSLTETGEYRLHLDTTFRNPISDKLALKVSWINDYNSNVGEEVKEHDMRLMTALEYSF